MEHVKVSKSHLCDEDLEKQAEREMIPIGSSGENKILVSGVSHGELIDSE